MAIKFTYEELAKEAQKYTKREEFESRSPEAYKKALNKGILHKITSHMDKGQISWTSEQILEEAKKYKNEKEFEKGCFKAYQAAQRKSLLEEIKATWLDEKIRKQEARYAAMRNKNEPKSKTKDDSFNRDAFGRQILTRPYKSPDSTPHWLYAILTVGGIIGGGIPGAVVVIAWLLHASSTYRAKEKYRKDAELWNSMYPEDKVDLHAD